MFRPVGTFMAEDAIKAFGVAKSFDRGQLDIVGLAGIEGAIAAVPDVGAGGRENCLGVRDALNRRELTFMPLIVDLRKAVDLFDVEDGVAPSAESCSKMPSPLTDISPRAADRSCSNICVIASSSRW